MKKVKFNDDGSVVFDSFIVSAGLLLEVARRQLGEEALDESENDDYVRLLVKDKCLLIFRCGKLVQVNFSPSHPDNLTWNSWSPEEELARKKQNDAFLLHALGQPHSFKGENPSYVFGWGRLLSCVDPKNSVAGIKIKYT